MRVTIVCSVFKNRRLKFEILKKEDDRVGDFFNTGAVTGDEVYLQIMIHLC